MAKVALWDFHEGSGSTATDTIGSQVLTADNPATAWSGPNAASRFTKASFTLAQPWTICVRVYLPSLTGSFIYYLVVNSAIYFYTDVGNKSVKLFSSPTGDMASANNVIGTGENTIVWTCDGSTTKIYANGTQVASTASAVGSFSTAALQLVGSDVPGNWPTGGLMRDLTLYDTALTAIEVAALDAPPGQSITITAGIASGETFGAPTVTAGPVSITITAGIASGEVFGTAALITGSTGITVAGIASSETFGSATLTVGAVLPPTELDAYPDAVYTIPAENTTVIVKPENTTATIKSENKSVTV